MAGKRVLVTAGATRESLDPVRFLTNHSSGKMGCAIARECMLRGAEVTLVAGHLEVEPPMFVKVLPAVSAAEMFETVRQEAEGQDIIIKAAAVADYTPAEYSSEKRKKESTETGWNLPLKRTEDILGYLGEHKNEQFLCGFSMETEQLVENSRKKLMKKHLDMIAANSLKQEGAGFGVDTNVLTLITPEGEEELPLLSKEEAAHVLLDRILSRLSG